MGLLDSINKNKLRLITGLIIGFTVLGAVFAGGFLLMLVVMYIVYVGSKEYVAILRNKGFRPFLRLIIVVLIWCRWR